MENLSKSLGLLYREFEKIIAEEKQPYVLFKEKLKRYEVAFSLAVEEGYPLSTKKRQLIQQFQLLLELRYEDIVVIEERILSQSSESKYETFSTAEVVDTSPRNDEIELLYDTNVDYTKLRDFLANGEWKEADIETARCMLKVAGQEEQGYLDIEDVKNFPCTDLCKIDQLWVKYSNGKFGFSVQKKIYQSLGGTKKYNREVWEKFGEQVGWIKGDKRLSYDELTFDVCTHYLGYLPGGGSLVCVGRLRGIVGGYVMASSGVHLHVLFSRAETCRL